MRFMRRGPGMDDAAAGVDPLGGVANLFDLGLVFIVGLLMMLFNVFQLHDFLDPTSEITITRKIDDEQLEVITKKGRKIEARRVTKTKAKGRGERLGIAYRLEDGSVVYVPN